MSEIKSLELRVSVDVGSQRHSVAVGLPDGRVLEEFEITHGAKGFGEFFHPHRETSKRDRLWGGGSNGRLQRLGPATR